MQDQYLTKQPNIDESRSLIPYGLHVWQKCEVVLSGVHSTVYESPITQEGKMYNPTDICYIRIKI